MADSDDDVPALDLEDDEADQSKSSSATKEKGKTAEIPNFRGKVPDVEKDDSKRQLKINWDADDVDDSEDDDSDDELPAEGEVGEEFSKARREALRQKREKRLAEEESDEEVLEEEDLWNFPIDKDKWDEDDIMEEWAEPWQGHGKTGFDPDLVDDWDEIERQIDQGTGPPVRPYYVPYRKHYPLIPEDHPDIRSPYDVVHELERYEEFLTWASYIFKDGSSYEGTVFDDLAHGKGVYTTAMDLSRYEGEWFQNAMEGHGVLEVDVPIYEPHPDSEAAKKWRAQGGFLNLDFLDDEDKEWIKMDMEDKMQNPEEVIDDNPFEDDEFWVNRFGEKPEKGHYRYSGQWKHSRMHGCGLYEVNGRTIYGQFYFGELLRDKGDCHHQQVSIHSGLAEIAAAKARMFINKPDGMVREARGPYTDPQHPYMYEEEDLWMAPGFINAFYPVPEAWKRYVEEVDEEQEMWLNSFIKSPFRIPMPPELEYHWAQNDEFILLSNRDSNPMLQHPENLNPDVEGEILLHTPTGNLINWADDPDGNLRFFIQPYTEDGEIRPESAIPLPLGFDEFMGIVDEKGNVVEESRRGLSPEERKKLEDEDRKKLKKKRFEAKLEELRKKASEKIKDLDTELYIHKLERKVERLQLEQRFRAELEAADEEAEYKELLAKDKVSDTAVKKDEPGAEGDVPRDDTDGRVGAGYNKQEDEEVEEDGKQEVEEAEDGKQEDDEDDKDDDDKKPRSFGTVAMLPPEEKRTNGNHSHASIQQAFPTIFASMSMVPQIAIKQVLKLSVHTVQRTWPLKFAGFLSNRVTVGHTTEPSAGATPGLIESVSHVSSPASCDLVKARNCLVRMKLRNRCRRLCHSSSGLKFPALTLPKHKCVPAVDCCLSALKHGSSSPQKGWRTINSHHSTRNTSRKVKLQLELSSVWTFPQMEVLSIALPVQIL